jgi:hypothetical protein
MAVDDAGEGRPGQRDWGGNTASLGGYGAAGLFSRRRQMERTEGGSFLNLSDRPSGAVTGGGYAPMPSVGPRPAERQLEFAPSRGPLGPTATVRGTPLNYNVAPPQEETGAAIGRIAGAVGSELNKLGSAYFATRPPKSKPAEPAESAEPAEAPEKPKALLALPAPETPFDPQVKRLSMAPEPMVRPGSGLPPFPTRRTTAGPIPVRGVPRRIDELIPSRPALPAGDPVSRSPIAGTVEPQAGITFDRDAYGDVGMRRSAEEEQAQTTQRAKDYEFPLARRSGVRGRKAPGPGQLSLGFDQ